MKKVTKLGAGKASKAKKKLLRVAAYCRVSTDSDAQLESLEAQKQHYENYISGRDDWEFAGLYFDEGISGTKKDRRPELLRMISDCEAGKIDFIITKSISRFARNTTDCLEMVRKLLELNIPIYFEKENLNTSSMESELFLAILSSMAEGESTSISENSKWSIQKRFQNGTFKISYPPYGYEWNGEQMVINPEQAEVVRWMFAQVLSGKGTQAVADALNEKGVPSKKGGRWTATTVRGMLANEKYTGDVIFQKTYTDSQFNRHVNRGEKDRYALSDHHEAIISREDFDAVRALIHQRGREKGIITGSDKYQNRYCFSGRIICGECGGTWKRVKLGSRFGFACNMHVKDKDACSMKSIKEEPVKVAFINLMNKLTFARGKILVPYLEMLKGSNDAATLERLDEIETLLEKNMERRQQIMQFFTKGLLDPAVYAEESDALGDEERRLSAEKDLLSGQMSGSYDQQEALTKLLKYTAKGKKLRAFDDDLFTEHVDHIVVFDRTEIGFAMKCGPTFRERI